MGLPQGWKKNLATLIFLSSFSPSYAPAYPLAHHQYHRETSSKETKKVEPKKIIVLDPGHDNKYTGKYKNGLREEELTLNLAQLLKPLLEKKGYEVILTREDEKPVNQQRINYNKDRKINLTDELLGRAAIAQTVKADYFLSLHFNALKYSNIKGLEVFFYGYPSYQKYIGNGREDQFKADDAKYHDVNSKKLATTLSERMSKLTTTPISVKAADFTVIKHNHKDMVQKKSSIPKILLECGFLTNKEDYERAKNHLDSIAYWIAESFTPEPLKEISVSDKIETKGIQPLSIPSIDYSVEK